jgi:uroporphyrinogen decarboxylase
VSGLSAAFIIDGRTFLCFDENNGLMKLDTDSMSAVDRVMATIHHEEPDRVPMYVMGIPPYSRCFKEFKAKEDEIFDGEYGENPDNILLTPLGDYTLKYYFGADVEMYGVGIHTKFGDFPLDVKTGKIIEDPSVLANLQPGQEIQHVNYFGTIHGSRILDSGERYSWYIDGYLKKMEDALAWYDRFGWPHEKDIGKVNVAAYEETMKQFGDRICLIPQIGGVQLYESTWVIMGQSRWAYYCRKEPEYIQKLINSRKDAQLRILDELKKLKPKVIFGGDDMGQKGRPMLSPEMYRKFFKQPYKEIFDKAHEMGAVIFNHSCGNIVELLPDMIEAGLDGWQSLEPASLIDHAAIKKKYGEKFFFVGGLDSREISFGSAESLENHVKTQIKAMGKSGGYITGPTHDFLTDTPLENCIRMRDAVQKWGKYPLSFD